MTNAIDMRTAGEPRISIVMATYNRRDDVLGTLHRLRSLGRETDRAEILVVDNHSGDGTARAIAHRFPAVKLIRLSRNRGSCAKAYGAAEARGEYLLFLDDDSFPRPGTIEGIVRRLDSEPRLAAAGCRTFLPNGREECSALPGVFIGCGVGLRRAAVEAVGGLDATLFMQAEEYDLSFRLVHAGWRVETFADLQVDHAKTPVNRAGARTVYLDTRNNLILAARYIPDPYEGIFRRDWMQRYAWIAARSRQSAAYRRGRIAGLRRRHRERRRYRGWRLDDVAFDRLFRFGQIECEMSRLFESGIRRPALAGLGKNIYPFARAARRIGMTVPVVADDRFASPHRAYRGIPIVPTSWLRGGRCDAVVVSDASPAHSGETAAKCAAVTSAPIHCWFGFDPPAMSGIRGAPVLAGDA